MGSEQESCRPGPVLVVEPDPAEASRAGRIIANLGYPVRHFPSPAEMLASACLAEASCLLLNLQAPGLPNGRELLSLLLRRANVPPVVLGLATADPVPLPRGLATLRLPYQEAALRQALACGTAQGRSDSEGGAGGDLPGSRRTLTRREREVLEAVVAGHSNKRIAADLGISVRTAEVHRARLMAKLGAHNLAELLRHAAAAGLLL